jgi:uncharacterized protein
VNSKEIIEKIKQSVQLSDPDAEVYLFGSRARGTNRSDSDWDLLILVNESNVTLEIEDRFRNGLYEIELEYGQIISTFIYSKDFWKQSLRHTPLYESVSMEGLRL